MKWSLEMSLKLFFTSPTVQRVLWCFPNITWPSVNMSSNEKWKAVKKLINSGRRQVLSDTVPSTFSLKVKVEIIQWYANANTKKVINYNALKFKVNVELANSVNVMICCGVLLELWLWIWDVNYPLITFYWLLLASLWCGCQNYVLKKIYTVIICTVLFMETLSISHTMFGLISVFPF